jgi:hypothetical protein
MLLGMPRRGANVLLAAGIVGLTATGLLGWLLPFERALWPFDLHRLLAAALLLVALTWKWRIAARSLARRWPGDRSVWAGLTLALVLAGAAGLGFAWTLGLLSYESLNGYSALNVHVFLGLALVPLLLPHLLRRWEGWPRRVEVRGRRAALRTIGLAVGAVALWRAIDAVATVRRESGSKHAGSFSGNRYPTTIWTFDEVPVVDRADWRLKALGRELSYDELVGAFPAREAAVVLDCTGGWWSEQSWRGVGLLDVLRALGLPPTARRVEVVSVTGHAWAFRVDELADALLATHVGGEELTTGHGYPVRLAVPGRRGFQWVKWVERVEVS